MGIFLLAMCMWPRREHTISMPVDAPINPLEIYRDLPPTLADAKRLTDTEADLARATVWLATNPDSHPSHSVVTQDLRRAEFSLRTIKSAIARASADRPTYTRMARLTAGLNRAQLASLARISESKLGSMERGRESTHSFAATAMYRRVACACAYYIAHAATINFANPPSTDAIDEFSPDINGVRFR